MANHRQTTSFLRRRFDEVGIHPDTRLGQNFLIDLNLVDLLVNAAELSERDVVLEVGTGTGSLTALMAQRAGHIVSVETDHQLHQLAAEELIDAENVTLLHQDVLRNKNNIHANVIDTLQTTLAQIPESRCKLVANLPFNIATPVVSNLLLTPIVPALMVVTIQKELADRIVAAPHSKDYGALSVWVQSLCSAEIVRFLPPTVFWPRPKVHSAIIRIEPHDTLREKIPDLPMFHQFVRAMFFHRRKFLRSVMISAYKNRLKKANIDAVMERMALGPDARTEQLSVAGLFELYVCVREELRSTGLL